MKIIGLLATVLLTASAGAAFAQDQAAPAEKEAAAAEKKVCRSEKMTGSLTRVKRTCMTQAQWDELSERTRKNVEDLTALASRRDRMSAPPGAASDRGF